ncbi:MAG TPA: PIG-L family deacetylase [Candidatus Saccharimonadales bacterium]
MKKIIFGIFAHPDDEAFGPSGTLLKETRSGAELHLITLTSGEAGVNLDDHSNLGEVRLSEWQKGGKLLGATSMSYFGYKDGQLTNTSMIEIANRLVEYIQGILRNAPANAIVEFMTFDLNGLTGHIDHIVAARATCWAFYNLRTKDSRLSHIRLFCLSAGDLPQHNTEWVYMESGRTPKEIDETVDARSYHKEILEVMHAHHTQRQDALMHIQNEALTSV